MAIPTYSDIKDLLKKGFTIEAQEKIIELREVAIQLQSENIELREQVRALQDAAAIRETVVWDAPYYWRQPRDGHKDGPFCQRCYDKDKNLIRLQDGKGGLWKCRECKSLYRDGSYRLPTVQSVRF